MKTLIGLILFLTQTAIAQQGVVASYVRLQPTTLPSTCKAGDLRTNASTGFLSKCGSGNAWVDFSVTGSTPMTTLGDTLYENSTPAAARLAGNTTSTKKFLTQTGTGSVSAAPGWNTIVSGDVPTLNQDTTGTATNATNFATTSSSANSTVYPVFVSSSSNSNQGAKLATGLTFNASTNTLTTTTFVGALTGNSSTATALAANPADCSSNNYATAIAANGDLTCGQVSLSAGVTGTLPIANGGTGQTTKAAAFDALSAMSASGDVLYGGASGTGTRLAKGTDGQVLTLASGLPAWVDSASGANAALSNLASVAVNAVLKPGTAGALDFGTTAKPWADIWMAGSSGTPGTNNFRITGASTSGTRTITLPDASGTVALTTLTSAHILVGNGSNLATDVAMSGDIAIANTGSTSYSGTVPVNKGGTGLTSGTSGGVLAYTGSGTIASSGALTQHAIVVGGGAGAVPTVVGSLGTSTTLLHGAAAGDPTFSAVSLTADVTGTLPVANGGTAVTSVTTSPTASSFAGWDANKNFTSNSFIPSSTSTATAAGTTTLVVGSTEEQIFTGSTTQTVKLPVVTTLVNGQTFIIKNTSSGVVTLQSSGANTVQAMAANTQVVAAVLDTTAGTTTASWDWHYSALNNNLYVTPMTTKGDLIGFSTVPARLGVGSDGQILTADAASTLGWKWATNAGGSGANTALSNLSSVAVNTAILDGAAAQDDFGSATLPWKDFWFAGSSSTPGTNNFRITGTATAARVITFPDLSSTVAETANNLSVFAATTSAQLAGVLSDETGTGVAVFGTSPTFTTQITSPKVEGGTSSGGNLTLSTTSNATKGKVIFSALSAFDAANDRLGIGIQAPGSTFDLYITKANNGNTMGLVENTSNGSAAWSQWRAYDESGNYASFGKFGSSHTTYGAVLGGDVLVYAPQNSLVLMAETASSSGQIKFAAGGNSQKMVLEQNGRLGIGTATPTSLLHSTENAAKTAAYTGVLHSVLNTSSTSSIAKIGMDVESTGTWNGTSATNTGLVVNATGGTTNYAATFSGGNVGIGTVTPAAQLHTTGTVRLANFTAGVATFDASGNVSSVPRVSFSANTSTTATDASTPMVFITKDHDTDTAYNASTGEFTVPTNKGGVYFFGGQAYYSASTVTTGVYVNGTSIASGAPQSSALQGSAVATVITVSAGDVVTLRASGTATASGGAAATRFYGYKIQ